MRRPVGSKHRDAVFETPGLSVCCERPRSRIAWAPAALAPSSVRFPLPNVQRCAHSCFFGFFPVVRHARRAFLSFSLLQGAVRSRFWIVFPCTLHFTSVFRFFDAVPCDELIIGDVSVLYGS